MGLMKQIAIELENAPEHIKYMMHEIELLKKSNEDSQGKVKKLEDQMKNTIRFPPEARQRLKKDLQAWIDKHGKDSQ